jgi:hypothetical protein
MTCLLQQKIDTQGLFMWMRWRCDGVAVMMCREVGVPLGRTFTINPKGQILKAATAVQSSTWSSLSAINDLVDEIFPALPAACTSGDSSRGLSTAFSSWKKVEDISSYAAAAGLLDEETLAAAVEQAKRKSSFTGGNDAAARVAAEHDGAVEHAATKALEQQQLLDDATEAGLLSSNAVCEAASPVARSTSDLMPGSSGNSFIARTAAARNAGRGGSFSRPPLPVDDAVPSREEYNDLHFWKPALAVDIQHELLLLQQGQHPQHQQQQQHQQQHKSG